MGERQTTEWVKISQWWVTLYDPNDKIIAHYRVDGDATIERLIATWTFTHGNIEYLKISADRPRPA